MADLEMHLVSEERIAQIAQQIGRDATLRDDELGCGDIKRAIRTAIQEAGEAAAKICDEAALCLDYNAADETYTSDEDDSALGCAAEIRKRLEKP